MSIVFQLVFGYFSDKYQTIKIISFLSVILYLIISFYLYDDSTTFFLFHLIVISMIGGLNNSLVSLFDMWVMGINRDIRNSLSFIKGFGSLGWALGSLSAVYIIKLFDYLGLKLSIIALVVVLLLLVYSLPDIEKPDTKVNIKLKSVVRLFKNYEYVVLVVSLLLMYSLIIANVGLVVDKMIDLGASDLEISLKWVMGSLLEIPMYLAGGYLFNKIRPIRLLQFSSLVLVIQFVLFAYAFNSIQIILISVLQIFTTPIIMVASKLIIYEIVPKGLINSSQLIALSVFTGLPSLIIPLIAGYSAVSIGFDKTLLMLSIVGIFSFIMTIVFLNIVRFKSANIEI